MNNFILVSLCALFFVACSSTVVEPSSDREPVTATSFTNAQSDAVGMLQSLTLPEGWDVYEQSAEGPVKFRVPESYESRMNDDSNDDAFYVATKGVECDEAYARANVAMNWGKEVPAEYDATQFSVGGRSRGYTWGAFDGVRGDATIPGWTHWCLDVSSAGYDIDISVPRTDASMIRFVQETLIPSWIDATALVGRQPTVHPTVNGLLSYDANAAVAVTTDTAPFPYDAASLTAMVQECDTQIDPKRLKEIEDTLIGTEGVIYHFAYSGESQDSGVFDVSVFPNALPYTDIKEFQNDFAPCYAGGRFYPHALSSKSIVFISSCGTGYDDGSGKPHGCEEAKRAVERSIVPL